MSIFETKEQYLNFRANWRQLHADGFHKQKVEVEQRSYTVKDGKWDVYTVGVHRVSALTVLHHLTFNLAIGRDPAKTFGEREPTKWNKPALYYNLSYGQFGHRGDFDIFGDTLTPEQKDKLQLMVQEYIKGL